MQTHVLALTRRTCMVPLLLSVSLLLSACVDMTASYQRAMLEDLARMANDPNAYPNGRKAPPLSAAELELYHEVAAYLHRYRNDPLVFDTSAALACDLNEDTRHLLAYGQTAAGHRVTSRRNELELQRQYQYLPLQLSVLEGSCRNGVLEGAFEAVTHTQYIARHANGMQQTVETTRRIHGVMKDGALNGPLQEIALLNNAVPALQSNTLNWYAGKSLFANNQTTGMDLTYQEFPQFYSTTVSRERSNGFRQVQSYTGSDLSTAYDTYRGKMYGFLSIYQSGRVLSSSCYWDGREAAESVCRQTPIDKPLETVVGVGIRLPKPVHGAFQVPDVIYPGPAAHAGVLPGDTVIAIDRQVLTAQHDEQAVMRMLRGGLGSTVEVQVLRMGASEPLTFNVVRDEIRTPVPN